MHGLNVGPNHGFVFGGTEARRLTYGHGIGGFRAGISCVVVAFDWQYRLYSASAM